MQKHYADRASVPGTLIISEATAISHLEEGQRNNPGLISEGQVSAWSKIIDAVHANGSFFFQQIWAMGRAATPEYMAELDLPYRSSSAVAMEGVNIAPRAMTEEEILDTIQSFVDTAKRAIRAGADGVEIHSAHGYLLDQFLSDNINQRTDRWGGSIENRARLTLEVVKAVVEAIGAERVAIRLSPYAGFQGAEKTDVYGLYTYIIEELKKMNANFAYLSLVEALGDPASLIFNGKEINQGKTLDFILEAWDNLSPVLVAGGYQPETAVLALEGHYKKWNVLVGFGRHFLANPDLVFRVKHGIKLNKYDRSTFYANMSETGYNDYPFSEEFLNAYQIAALESRTGVALQVGGTSQMLGQIGVKVDA
jgi:NADPH2 dehydrogenase